MSNAIKVSAAACVLWGCWKAIPAIAEKPISQGTSIEAKLSNLVRVTPTPRKMKPDVAKLCGPAIRIRKDHSQVVKSPDAVIHVYVSPEGEAPMRARDATPFPIGTVILKEKFEDSSARNVVLYTGMLKQATGYNPECGDWEFFTLSGDAKTVTSRGRLESCMDCHKSYAATDFVTKQYPVER